MKVTDLPTEIFIEIVSYCNLKDTCSLMTTCKNINKKITNIQEYIAFNEICYINNCKNYNEVDDYKEKLYNYLESFCKQIYLYTRKDYICWLYNTNENDNNNDDVILKNEIIKIIKASPIISCYNNDTMLSNLVVHYINNKDLKSYNNKLTLLSSFYFIKIMLADTNPVLFEFINSLFSTTKIYKQSKYIDFSHKYFTKLLNSSNYISFDNIYNTSKYIICNCALKKLMGYKLLDLKQTKLIECNKCESSKNLNEIVLYKRSYTEDDLIGYNYEQYKNLLKRENKHLYNYIKKVETNIVNSYIYITSPVTNKKINILCYSYKLILSKLRHKEINNILNYISEQQKIITTELFC